ncbi:kinase binding protein CGI-121-domain-containing protein [Boeremia exigua]|uniref:kinase binding protein CGI-121-domain-containing protein n=1 Tax=Boeremia exigua TaxID=749465 RepID=UPI001E8D4BEC|nr:kinase binding protein CGI-121-domain-containing protein [Boeremia exigua]KAH6639175.1 kinase binding protein CGI-121-domain-containing protein [Boeremia exigua]
MAAVRTFTLPHYEAYPVHIALFEDVSNAAYLRSQLLAANPEFDYAFIDAAMILTPTHLLSATALSLHAFLHSSPKTHTPHSELLFRLSPTNNIGEAYRLFGIADSTTAVIAVKLALGKDGRVDPGVSAEGVGEFLGRVVEGRSVEIEVGGEGEGEEGLGARADVHRIKKVYKISCAKGKGGKGAKGGNGGEKDDRAGIESVVLGAMALKGW